MAGHLRRSFLQTAPPVDGDASALAEMALVDLSLRPRTGFKGGGTPEWLAAQGLILPEPNLAARQADEHPGRPAGTARGPAAGALGAAPAAD